MTGALLLNGSRQKHGLMVKGLHSALAAKVSQRFVGFAVEYILALPQSIDEIFETLLFYVVL